MISLSSIILFFGCGLLSAHAAAAAMDETYAVVFKLASKKKASEPAQYDCEFYNLWTSDRHPKQFPAGAHWSPTVIASHNSNYQMFEVGTPVTDGVELVAETGDTGVLKTELDNEGSNVLSTKVGARFDAIDLSSKDTLTDIAFDMTHPFLSAISMIAPSPDWMSGVSGFDMRVKKKGKMFWARAVILDLHPLDAGGDSGDTYTAADSNEDGSLFVLTLDTIPSTMVFASPEGTTVLPTARLQCTLKGRSIPKCNREVTETCNRRRRSCCPGNKCFKPENRCMPCLQKTQTCTRDKDCCKQLRCNKDNVCA